MHITAKLAFYSIVLTIFLTANLTGAEKLPVEAFASLPDVKQVQLSPDGKHFASLVRVQGKEKQGTALSIYNLETNKQHYPIMAGNLEFVINWVSWANNNKMFASATFADTRQGIPTTETRLLIIDIKTNKIRNSIPKRYVKKFLRMPQFQDNIIDFLPEDDEHFLLALDGFDPGSPTLYKVALNKRKMVSVHRAKPNVYNWMTDQQHKVRIAYYFKDTTYKILHSMPNTSKWKTLWQFESFAADQVWPIGFDKDPNYLYVNALHQGRDAIFKVDIRDPKLTKELILSDPKYDINGSLIYSKISGEVIGLSVNKGDGYVFWDKKYQALQRGINKALPDTDNYFYSFSHDEQKYILFSSSDTHPGVYYLGNRKDKSLSIAARQYSQLNENNTAKKQRVNYKARDGLEIEAYLTLPKGNQEATSLPTVIFPHGGPISYDGIGFDYWVQFFANRGYAVLQMNFRGSSGYGHNFMKAGLQNWGLAMQDDVEDGARWMIKQGYSDPKKICIVGASYGGYAALMGSVKTPDLYQCAVSFAGVSDVAYLVKSSRRYDNYEIVKEQIGSNMSDLKKRSPVRYADKISIPTLLIHGNKDRRVRVEHSRRMHRALKKANKDVQYLELEEGNHYLSNNDHRIATFKAMDEFLAKYLGE
ncbi:alpha/beta hydrolase family protein [Agarilytica rhodophyticola]|uniref:alpha/beta hydrolase family protein n=1 Tax=Agarilytica rhodophyticola TaxID=1737490 RepID=UPI001C1FE448|nr:S9 family peptidase [Agarilytica rhodophyticola]